MQEQIPKKLIQEFKDFINLLSASLGGKPPEMDDEAIVNEIKSWMPKGEGGEEPESKPEPKTPEKKDDNATGSQSSES